MSNQTIKIKSSWSLSKLSPGIYSFLNLASITSAFDSNEKILSQIQFYCDGGLLSKLISILTTEKIRRVSFDFTSIADEIFKYCESNDKTIYFVGAEQKEVTKFVSKIMTNYPSLKIAGYHNGYFKNSTALADKINDLNVDFVVAGLGAGRQETFLFELLERKFKGIGFSCGGFIRQFAESKSETYYPYIINKLKLRGFYRMYKEPHTIKRYFLDYPKNIILLPLKVYTRKIIIKLV